MREVRTAAISVSAARVLMIEDEPEMLRNMITILAMEGFTPLQAANGRLGVDLARAALGSALGLGLGSVLLFGWTRRLLMANAEGKILVPLLALASALFCDDVQLPV